MKRWHGIRFRRPLARGTLVQWFADRAYGWVESGQNRLFVHINDVQRGRRRPEVGDEVRFIAGVDRDGRPCAKQVTFLKADKAQWSEGILFAVVLLIALPVWALFLLPLPWWIGAGVMLLASVITYARYAHDKHQSVSGGQRVPEGELHLGELLGGWPGAFLAQRALRHKCSKPSYQFGFWMIVLLYQTVALDVILDHRLSRELIKSLAL